MRLRKATIKVVLALAGAGVASAHAQTAGTFYVATGWFHFAPQSSSDPVQVLSVGGRPVPAPLQSVPNTGARIDSSDTLGLGLGYFITDHLAAEIEAGIPPKFDINGADSLSAFGKLGSARLWNPTLLFKWHFLKPDSKIRPYVGVGVTRVWFTDAQLTNTAFESTVLGGPTSVSTDRSWAPVFNLGVNYSLSKHWFAGVSVSYIPLSTTAHFTTTNAAPLGLTRLSQAKIRLDPIVTYAKIGYAF
jgi:outer membrane protein